MSEVHEGGDEWNRVVRFPKILGYSLRYSYSLEEGDVADAPPMHEGYALFFEEERDNTRPIIITSSFIVTVISVVMVILRIYYRTLAELVITAILILATLLWIGYRVHHIERSQ